jgi:hypothetical protein
MKIRAYKHSCNYCADLSDILSSSFGFRVSEVHLMRQDDKDAITHHLLRMRITNLT